MAIYSTVHTTKAYYVATYNYGYERSDARYNFLICFSGNTNMYTLAELMQRYKTLTVAQQRIVDIVRRKYGVK